MAKYRRLSFQFEAWMNSSSSRLPPQWIADIATRREENGALWIATPEGVLRARVGDWILCDETGRVFTCAADMFDRLYEPLQTMKSQEAVQSVSMVS